MAMSRLPGGRWFTDAVADGDRAAGDGLEAGDHPEQGRLAAAGRADQHDELAVRYVDADAMQDLHGPERLRYIADCNLRHRPPDA